MTAKVALMKAVAKVSVTLVLLDRMLQVVLSQVITSVAGQVGKVGDVGKEAASSVSRHSQISIASDLWSIAPTCQICT